MVDAGQAVAGKESESQGSPHVAATTEPVGRPGAWDTSEHDWLEGRGEKLCLIAMIDDDQSVVRTVRAA